MSATDVTTPLKEKDDHNAYQETGIFVTHKKLCSIKNNTTNNILFTICILLTLQQCLATFDSSSALNANVYKPSLLPPAPYECSSIDLRNDCEDFDKLKNCTVITGFLSIAQLPRNNVKCNFSSYQFENLREITDFFIINDVRNLSSIKTMFPNLTVIRGQQLFLNYALVITSAYDLEKIEFKSLIAIQRGHVFLDDNPKLCYLEKINWNRLTLRRGKNRIFLHKQAQCDEEAKCNGCKRDSCWSNDVCQKLENDSVLSLMQDTTECHPLCLGGCYNRTAQGCVVCKSWSDHGTCVDKCPSDKYASSRYLRCYTRDECVIQKKQFIYKNTCVEYCPNGYQLNDFTKECDSCGGINNCLRVCHPNFSNSVIYISSIMQAENIKGCAIINATVMVNINEYFDQDELVVLLEDVREIIGHLKINRSPYLTSLKFFQNLDKIHGLILENKLYALIIYNNQNLTDLWTPKQGFEILNGGLYIHANDKLCNTHIRLFRDRIMHDRGKDSFQTSDQEVLCAPAVLNLHVQTLSHRSLKFYWPRPQTSFQTEIIYRPLNGTEVITENSELDTNVCERINWRRELKFSFELKKNLTHASYTIYNLEPHTRYACLVKTFNGEVGTGEARSEIKYATTLFDIPMPPKIFIKSKTHDTLEIELAQENSLEGSQVVDYFILEVYNIPDDKELLDTRDYCDEPILHYKDYGHEDYDDCCYRREEEKKEQLFLQKLKKDFSCTLDHLEYCQKNDLENTITTLSEAILSKRLEVWQKNYTIKSLESFHLYVLQAQACNHAGCGSYTILSSRTNYSLEADKIQNFSACKVPDDSEYQLHFFEPEQPNGYITSYALHFRDRYDTNGSSSHPVICITRLEHELNNFVYKANFNYSFNEAAVRVHSLGHHSFIGWINITACPITKSARRKTNKAWNIFLVCFLIGAFGTILWICYKRRYWREIPNLRRYLPLYLNWRYLRSATNTTEDRQILVDGFETVRFHNNPNEDVIIGA